MKKTLLFLALIITTFAFSQEINTVSGGVEFKLPSGATYSYSDNTQIYVTIDNTNKAKFYNKVGGQVFGSYYFYDISIDGDSLTSKSDFLNAINQISAFTQLSIDCGGGECCADSLTVIGNILYLFQNGDTLMAELPSGGGSSLWGLQANTLIPIDTTTSLNFNQTLLVKDSTNLFGFVVEYSGIRETIGDSAIYFNGLIDLTPIGGEKTLINAVIDSSFNFSGMTIQSSGETSIEGNNGIYITSENNIEINAVSSLSLNSGNTNIYINTNGIVFPSFSTEPAGEIGAIYFNTTTNLYRRYTSSGWETF
ncbi:MAG: hypothetical protein H6552_00345 [Chitinophagales bacterium]|nr:hypothetical protein [Chitinophagales bacterium]